MPGTSSKWSHTLVKRGASPDAPREFIDEVLLVVMFTLAKKVLPQSCLNTEDGSFPNVTKSIPARPGTTLAATEQWFSLLSKVSPK